MKQSYLIFRLFTAMLLSLGVIWLKSVLVMGLPVIDLLAASGLSAVLVVGLMDKLNQYKSSVLGVAHEG